MSTSINEINDLARAHQQAPISQGSSISGGITPPPAAAEARLVEDYHRATATVEALTESIEQANLRLQKAKAEAQRLYRIASVIDPSLRRTRPKAAAE